LSIAVRPGLVLVLAAAVVVFGPVRVLLTVVVHVVVVMVHVLDSFIELLTRVWVQVVLLCLVLFKLGHLNVRFLEARPIVNLVI